MIRPKAIKSKKTWYMRDQNTLVGKVRYWLIKEVVWKIEGYYRRYKERIFRSLSFAKFAWLNYDFDFICAYHLLEFKLKRLEKCLQNGHAVQENSDMDALKELIKVVHRLGNEQYEDKYHDMHDKRWGKRKKWLTEPVLDKDGKPTGSLRMIAQDRPKVKNDKQRKQERKEFMNCWKMGEKDRLKDINKLAKILKMHSRSWWD